MTKYVETRVPDEDLSSAILEQMTDDMTLRERLAAVAEEYQREPRWLRSQTVGLMLEEWLEGEVKPGPGPCPATTESRSVALGPDDITQRCDLRAGHAGDHEAALPHGGNVRWWDA
jgi:hypothetical protein